MDPGPSDPSLLVLQDQHRSGDIWAAAGHGSQDSAVLTCRRSEAQLRRRGGPSEPVRRLVRQAGFTGLLELPFVLLDWHLITALVERWRPETHTFHLRSGEATVTLQDVELLLGLRVDGLPVTGRTDLDWAQLCDRLLGIVPPPADRKGGRVRMTWLRDNFTGEVADDAAPVIVAREARAYILKLLGGSIFADNSGSYIHLMFLELLADFVTAANYSWGSAALAFLYSHLCHGAASGAKDVGGMFLLVQVWAWDRFPHLSPRRLGRQVPPAGSPLITRWWDAFVTTDYATHVVSAYRYALDQQTDNQVVWVPYSPELIDSLPEYCRAGVAIWRACVPLVCFATVELHQPDRVMRQFGFRQIIPGPSSSLDLPHGLDLRGSNRDWRVTRAPFLALWEQRLQRVVPAGLPDDGVYPLDDPYTTWYQRVTRRFVSQMGAVCYAMRRVYEEMIVSGLTTEQVSALGHRGLELSDLQHSLLRGPPPLPVPTGGDAGDGNDNPPLPVDHAATPPIGAPPAGPTPSPMPPPGTPHYGFSPSFPMTPLFGEGSTSSAAGQVGGSGSSHEVHSAWMDLLVDPVGSSGPFVVEGQDPKRMRVNSSSDEEASQEVDVTTSPSEDAGVVTQLDSTDVVVTPIATRRVQPPRDRRPPPCGTGGRHDHPSGRPRRGRRD